MSFKQDAENHAQEAIDLEGKAQSTQNPIARDILLSRALIHSNLAVTYSNLAVVRTRE